VKPAGVILAGGRSSRMGGGHKGLLTLDGVSMLGRVLSIVTPQTEAVLINSNSDPALFETFRATVLADCVPGHLGPLSGLLTAMLWARQYHPRATHLLSAPCDTPYLPTDLAARLTNSLAGGDEIAIARDVGQVHPTLGLWPVALAERLATDLVCHGMRRMRAWLAQFIVREVHFDAACLKNINTPEDLAAPTVSPSNIPSENA
jgi:molybdopterin-guanine dinucleotide biosynthesis protein A